MHMDNEALLRRLRVFLAVVDHGGVGEAARALGVSQPAVSAQIKKLETDLGLSLFRRSGRRLITNQHGQDICDIFRSGLGQLNTTLNAVRDVAHQHVEPLRFGFSAPQIALDAAEVFRRYDPRTVLELRAANSADLFSALDAYDLDVIMIGLQKPRSPYHCQFFKRQHMVALVPVGHPFASMASITLADLAREPIVLREQGSYTRAILMAAFEEAGLRPNVAFEVATREAVTEAVRRGFGVGPVLDRELPRSDDLRAVVVEQGAIVSDDYLVCHASALHNGQVRRFFTANQTASSV